MYKEKKYIYINIYILRKERKGEKREMKKFMSVLMWLLLAAPVLLLVSGSALLAAAGVVWFVVLYHAVMRIPLLKNAWESLCEIFNIDEE